MKDTLSNFELTILGRITKHYPFVQSHITLLRVKSRENTGVGMYINFYYINDGNSYQPIPVTHYALSSNSHLYMEGLKHGLAYEIAISNGKIDFLELVTYGEDWDGTV